VLIVDNLRDICHVCTNRENDRFVGIKANTDGVSVSFPLGYRLPPVTHNEQDLRRDILHLIFILKSFTSNSEGRLSSNSFCEQHKVEFPINAYITIISDFLMRSYYKETEISYITRNAGKTNWKKTIQKHLPLIQSNGSAVYTKFEVRNTSPNTKSLISLAHECCVYEAFQKLGWLFSSIQPRKPQLSLSQNRKMFINIIRDKLLHTFIDNNRRLFQSMLDMLNNFDEETPQNNYYFGTNHFEYVWEKLIDKAFGVKNKSKFFPHTHWRYLPKNRNSAHDNFALEPDTIMITNIRGKQRVFVLDAKYYRFGVTGIPYHLPASSSINKQITYGEFVNTNTEYNGDEDVYNAFLMPYNSEPYDKDNIPNGNRLGLKGDFVSIGEAYGEWKTLGKSYETVQGILVDSRFLMYHYANNKDLQIRLMSELILDSYEKHKALYQTDNKIEVKE
jgi:hypothetical protein